MDSTWSSIEDLARTSDDAATRRRFDNRNVVWLAVLLFFFTFVSFLEVVAESRSNDTLDVLVGSANFALCAFGFFALFSKTLRAWMRKRISAVVITYVAIQFALVLIFTRSGPNWIAWAVLIPMLVVVFRMQVAELALVHSLLTAGGILMALVTSQPDHDHRFIPAFLVINALALGAELFFSRRLRKEVIGEWTERRAHAREQIRMRDELQYARELQLSMLPECSPALSWADICSISVPATEVGGDYYDYFVDRDRVAIVCGDVAGHGMAAGLVLSALRSGFTLLRDALDDPAAVLRRLHDLVAQTSRRRMLVTVSVVLLDHARGRAIIASAGHPPIIFRRADGTVEAIELYAPPLGVRLPVEIPQRTLDVAAGDVFVLHSDGVYESRNAAGEEYGLERLAEVVRTHGGGAAEDLREAILGDLAAFRGSAEADDDVTLVVCRLL